MAEISINEYVRTKRGIAKILEIKTVAKKMYGNHDKAYRIDKTRMYVTETEFLKHSKNIIDLIEEGDYVNGYRVISVDKDVLDIHTDCIELDLNNNYQYNFITINQIKSILTKEKFKSVEYRIKENTDE